jgi:hypothetical protein
MSLGQTALVAKNYTSAGQAFMVMEITHSCNTI